MSKIFSLILVATLSLGASAAEVTNVPSLGSPLGASGPAFKLPISTLLAGNPELRANVVAQIQSVRAFELGAAASQVPAINRAPLSADLVRGLLAHPDIVVKHSAELTGLLGAENMRTLAAISPQTALVRQFMAAGGALNVNDQSSVDAFAGKLNQLFEGSAVRGGESPAAVLADVSEKAMPKEWKLSPAQQVHLDKNPVSQLEAFQILKNSLKDMGQPAPKEIYVENKIDEPAIAWAGLPSVWKLAMFQEGGRQDEGNVLYVLDSSWYIQVPQPDGTNLIYVTKGLYYEKDGETPVIATYKHPRRTRYFGNLLTLGAFETDAGVPLEKNLNAPMSSSSKLEKTTNDKLWTRLLAAEEGANVPATRAFMMPDHRFLKRGRIPGNGSVKAGMLPRSRAEVREAVVSFLAGFDGPEVVVKPSGPKFHSGYGVGFFQREKVDAITDYVIKLSQDSLMESDGVVLLEQRITPLPIFFRLVDFEEGKPFGILARQKVGVHVMSKEEIAAGYEPHEKKDSNQRVWIIRDTNDEPYTVPLSFFRAGTWGKPTSGQPKDPRDAAAVIPFEVMREALMKQHGVLMTDEDVADFHREMDDIGKRVMRAVMRSEREFPREDGDPLQAQTDMAGMDLMYQLVWDEVKQKFVLKPFLIELNDHDAAGQFAVDRFYPERKGEHSRKLVETWRHRARVDAQRNP
jgi:hypothetical protein